MMINPSGRISKIYLTGMVFLLCHFPLFTSCSVADSPPSSVTSALTEIPLPTETPTITPQDIITPTSQATNTPTITATVTKAPTIISPYTLPSGEYITYWGRDGTIYAIRNNDRKTYQLTDTFGHFSPNYDFIISFEDDGEGSYIYDLMNNETLYSTASVNSIGLSPDGHKFAHMSDDTIIVESIDGERKIELTQINVPDLLIEVNWSPQGRYIAYVQQDWAQGTVPTDGVYLIDADCLLGSWDCPTEITGPIFSGALLSPYLYVWAWSPNDQFLALAMHMKNSIRIYDTKTGIEKELTTTEPIISIAWSPDSDQIVYAYEEGFNIVSIATGEVTTIPIEEYHWVNGWIRVPEE